MRTLALDYGERRIGVAVTDPTGSFAQPLETIQRGRPGAKAHLRRIEELVRSYEVKRVVVGLPLHMNGQAGPEVAVVHAFGAEVAACTGVEVEYLDERWTSREAERLMRSSGVSERKRRGRVDPVAAALLLQTWLARQGT